MFPAIPPVPKVEKKVLKLGAKRPGICSNVVICSQGVGAGFKQVVSKFEIKILTTTISTTEGKYMKLWKLRMAVVAFATILVAQAHAAISTYDISFTGGSSALTGYIDVQSGQAIDGEVYVTEAGVDSSVAYNLVTLASPLVNGNPGTIVDPSGDDIIFDTTFPIDSTGLAWANSDAIGFNLWSDGGSSYTLYSAGNGLSGHIYNIDDGTATITAVPEPATTSTYAGIAALGLLLLSRRRKVSQVG